MEEGNPIAQFKTLLLAYIKDEASPEAKKQLEDFVQATDFKTLNSRILPWLHKEYPNTKVTEIKKTIYKETFIPRIIHAIESTVPGWRPTNVEKDMSYTPYAETQEGKEHITKTKVTETNTTKACTSPNRIHLFKKEDDIRRLLIRRLKNDRILPQKIREQHFISSSPTITNDRYVSFEAIQEKADELIPLLQKVHGLLYDVEENVSTTLIRTAIYYLINSTLCLWNELKELRPDLSDDFTE